MNVLFVLFAVLMGGCCLLVFALAAALLVEMLYRLWPILAQFDVDLSAPIRLPEWARRRDWQIEEPPVLVCLARNPLSNPAFLVGSASGQVVWAASKQHARILELSDRLAIKAWIAYVENRENGEIFICLSK